MKLYLIGFLLVFIGALIGFTVAVLCVVLSKEEEHELRQNKIENDAFDDRFGPC